MPHKGGFSETVVSSSDIIRSLVLSRRTLLLLFLGNLRLCSNTGPGLQQWKRNAGMDPYIQQLVQLPVPSQQP